MSTTTLSSKGQVVIPKSLRERRHWREGLELLIVETPEGLLLKPAHALVPTKLAEVAGILKAQVSPKTDEEIEAALTRSVREKWRDGH